VPVPLLDKNHNAASPADLRDYIATGYCDFQTAEWHLKRHVGSLLGSGRLPEDGSEFLSGVVNDCHIAIEQQHAVN
jgi:hypothetical protein